MEIGDGSCSGTVGAVTKPLQSDRPPKEKPVGDSSDLSLQGPPELWQKADPLTTTQGEVPSKSSELGTPQVGVKESPQSHFYLSPQTSHL